MQCTCDFDKDAIAEVRRFLNCPKAGEKTWRQKKEIKPSWEDRFNYLWDNGDLKQFKSANKQIKDFIRQTIKTEREEAYEQGKTGGLALRKNYNDIKPEIIKREREQAVKEFADELERKLPTYNNAQRDIYGIDAYKADVKELINKLKAKYEQ